MPWSVIGRQTVWGHQTPVGRAREHLGEPDRPGERRDRVGRPWDRRTRTRRTTASTRSPGRHPTTTPAARGRAPTPTSSWWSRPTVARPGPIGSLVDDGGGAQQWFPWADHKADGSLAIAWDQDDGPAPADTFHHVLWDDGGTEAPRGRREPRRFRHPLGRAVHDGVAGDLWSGRLHRRRRAGGGQRLQRLPRRLHGARRGPGRRDPHRVDRPEPARHVAAGGLLHRRRARRLRPGRDVRAPIAVVHRERSPGRGPPRRPPFLVPGGSRRSAVPRYRYGP